MNDLSKVSRFEKAEKTIRKLTSGAIKISIIILFCVIAWRLAWSEFSLDLSKFDFSDLLAMILALFAVGMSVAFYFKSTDSSNQFYDNIYNFTQKTSEILGRIEERFGERLKHLDEGYGRIESRFDGISNTPDEIQKQVKETEGKEEKEKQKLEDTNKAMQEMIETLAQRAELQQQEKEEFYKNMEILAEEKDAAQKRIREIEEDRDKMQQQLYILERDIKFETHDLHNPVIEEVLHHPGIRSMMNRGVPSRIIKAESRSYFSDFPNEMIQRLQKEGILNDRRELTTAGCTLLRALYRSRYK